MLQKNVYIMYPPGYSGSYINWAINSSDQDLKKVTVDNPINNEQSKKFGGKGTAHLHVRIPTHQGIYQHLTWVLYNKPTDSRVYIINSLTEHTGHNISTIAQYDPTGIFINIHDNNDESISSYGTINCVTKWPTYVDVMLANQTDLLQSRKQVHENFNPYECSKDIEFRNWAVNNENFFRHNNKLNYHELSASVQRHRDWFQIRHTAQPHEVNETYYISNPDLKGRVFELSCLDICNEQFVPWFENFMLQSKVSNDYNCGHIPEIHEQYIASQPNLQWFESIKQWEQTGNMDDYLLSHSIIEAQVIKQIFKNSNRIVLDHSNRDHWVSFYSRCRGPDWPDADTEYDYFNLPDWVKKEIVDFGYKFTLTENPDLAILSLDWENMTTKDINDVYQQTRSTK